MKVFLPDNLDFSKDIINYDSKHREKYVWIIHSIIDGAIRDKDNKDGRVHLQATLLRSCCGGNIYTTIRGNLKQSGIIDWEESYLAGVESMTYWLTDKYRMAPFSAHPFRGPKANKCVMKYNSWITREFQEAMKKQSGMIPVIEGLKKSIQLIDIDRVGALKCANDLVAEKSGKVNLHKASCYRASIESIASKEGNVSPPHPKTGRIYHNIANLKREFRQFLSVGGKKLHQADICNSQVVLFVPFLAEFQKNPPPKFQTRTPGKDKSSVPMPTIPHPFVDQMYDDALLFKELTAEAKFYEYLMKKWKIKASERDDFKVDFFKQIFYSENADSKYYPNVFKFKAEFPTVYAAVSYLKTENNEDLPNRLQQVEADVVYNSMCTRIMEERKGSPMFFLTVHDSIVCLEEDMPYVKKVMQQELERRLGFKIKVKSGPF